MRKRAKNPLRWAGGLGLALVAAVALLVGPVPAGAAAEANQGGYQLVGLGPGDPDLMTPRQVRAIAEADVVFCDAKTRDLLAPLVDMTGKRVIEGYNLVFPFYGQDCAKVPPEASRRWGKTCAEFKKLQADFTALVRQAVGRGQRVVMLSGGDPTIYGPGVWTLLALKDLNPKVVPGLSSFNAANAALKVGLGEVIITAPFQKEGRADTLENLSGHDKATLVIFMPRELDALIDRLAKVNPPETPVAVVADAGMRDRERVILGAMADIKAKLAGQDLKNSLVYLGRDLARSQYRPGKPGDQPGRGKFYLVGMGPGDPDLATLRALEVIKKADLVFAGRDLQERFASELAGKRVLDGYHRLFPFFGKDCAKLSDQEKARERMSCEEYQRKQAEFVALTRQAMADGQTVAMLDSGDPLVYGPCSWTLTALADLETEVVPGLSCFNAANAALAAGVTEGKTSHSVLLASGWTVEEMARHRATMVLFTMRTEFKKFIDALAKHYPPETPVAIVFEAGFQKDERVMRGTLGGIMHQVSGQKLPFHHLLYVGDFLTNEHPF
ncbi:MAG: tetrapyrrole methylase [Desulfarculus sp.]|nr:tetrapyrrole methylase [Desulfarculus sp.]